MTAPGNRLPAFFVAVLIAVTGVLLFGYAGRPAADRATAMAPTTSNPTMTIPPVHPTAPPSADPASTLGPSTTPAGTPSLGPSPEPAASPTTEPTGTGLVPGSVDRTSLDLSATYAVNAAIAVRTGVLDVSTTITVRNTGTKSIDRLELNTVAARLGRLRVSHATVAGARVGVSVDDQTLIVPLGGILEPGATTTVQVTYRATLRRGLAGSDWLFTRSGGTIALYRWIPWISRAVPFDRPNQGDPFVTISSPEVSVELITDVPLVLAAPAAEVATFAAGKGGAWAFTVRDVRDVSLVLAPDFVIREETVDGVKVRAYSRGDELAADRLLGVTSEALREERRILGLNHPWPALVAVETEGGEAIESPGLLWIPRTLDTLDRIYLVHHGVAHQWFYGAVGNDQRNDPFLDEAPSDLLARTVLGTLRRSGCTATPLDGSIARYAGRCYYEVVYVQGALLLDDVRARLGTDRFWKALAGFVDANRFGMAGTRELLDALEAAAPDGVRLRPLFRARFPGLY